MAYHLAARGCHNVLVLDRAPAPGHGSSGRATGGFRAQFGTEVNVRLSLLARDKLRRFAEETGVDPGYRPCGYLFVAHSEAGLARLEAARAVQRAAGFREAVRVGPEEIQELNPALQMEGIAGGTFCATDGFLRPLEILRGYTEAAQRLGVRFRYGVQVEGVRMGTARRIAALRTRTEEISTDWVVNAAGAWAAQLAALAGVRIPVHPLRRQVAITHATPLLPEDMPMSIFLDDGFHLRVRDGRVLLLWPDDPRDVDPFDTTVDPAWVARVERKAHERVPCLRGVRIDHAACWAGLYEMSPDAHALLGPAPGVDNLLLANGSSGHGVMHAPALGQLLAEMLLDGHAHSLDATPLHPARFRSAPVPEAAVLL